MTDTPTTNDITRRTAIQIAAAAALAIPLAAQGLGFENSVTKNGNQMNVITIMTDDLAASAFNAVDMPRCYALAQANSVLGHQVQQNCVPSRAAFMTGKDPSRMNLHAVSSEWSANAIPLTERLLSQEFEDAGYLTGFFGKWHLGGEDNEGPFQRGFTHGIGFEHGWQNPWAQLPDGSAWPDGTYGHDHGAGEKGIDLMHRWGGDDAPMQMGLNQTDYTSSGAQAAMRQAIEDDKNFFIYAAFGAPHDPRSAPASYMSKALNRYPLTPAQLDMIDWYGDVAALTAARARTEGVSAEDEAAIDRTIYYGCVRHLDDRVADIIEAVETLGLSDNTVIVFMNDNGSGGADPLDNGELRGFKGSFWEGAHRTPNFIIHPNLTQGEADDKFVWIGDWYQTLTAMAGVSSSQNVDHDGRDLSDYIVGGYPAPRFADNDFTANIHIENRYRPTTDTLTKGFACVTGVDRIQWKYVIRNVITSGVENIQEYYYDLINDPGETSNLLRNRLYEAGLERHRDKFNRLGLDWGVGTGGWDYFNHIREITIGDQGSNGLAPVYWTHGSGTIPVTRPRV